jgi:CRISPR/Cas system endoribonuclease Cas6 (RAMP superfamily)
VYLKKEKDRTTILQYLDFYIEILSLRMQSSINMDYTKFLDEIKRIYKQIKPNDDMFTKEIKTKITNNYQNLDDSEIGLELFDEALCFSFELLESKFSDFKSSDAYYYLVHRIRLNSDIFCRMYNTGLIRKN